MIDLRGIGVAVGVGCAALATRYLEGLLFGVTPLDPLTFVVVSLMFMAIAVLASALPARRAAAIDPLSAL